MIGYVSGWDDPRMPTIQGLRRRGYTPEILNDLVEKVGVTRNDNIFTSIKVLENCCRTHLDGISNRAMVILEPLKVVLTNFDGTFLRNAMFIDFSGVKMFSVSNHAKNPSLGSHEVPFSKVIYIEASDFRLEDAKVIVVQVFF